MYRVQSIFSQILVAQPPPFHVSEISTLNSNCSNQLSAPLLVPKSRKKRNGNGCSGWQKQLTLNIKQ